MLGTIITLYRFMRQKQQLEAAYKRQQQEIAELKDFVARNKARSSREIWLCPDRKTGQHGNHRIAKEKPNLNLTSKNPEPLEN